MGQLVAIDAMTPCDHCDDEVGREDAVTANVQMHDDPEPMARVWHRHCCPEEILLIIEMDEVYDEENSDEV